MTLFEQVKGCVIARQAAEYKSRRQKQIQKDAPKQEYFDIKET